jgi:translocator protein
MFSRATGVAHAEARSDARWTLPAALLVAAAVVGVAGAGGLATDTGSSWYRSLEKPAWQPPGWVFGPVWSVLYALLGLAAFLAWRDAHGPRRRPLLALFVANGVLNAAWTYIFFAAKRPFLAGVEILALLATIVAMSVLLRPFSRLGARALVPYGAWVAYAATINWAIAVRN